jgi:uncharacterized protein
MSERIVATPEAKALITRLQQQHGPLLIHQSGGCCDGSAPVCMKRDEFRVSARDVLVGDIEGTPFYVGAAQREYFADSDLVLDVMETESDSFSLEAAEGFRFVARSTQNPTCATRR